MLPQCSHVPHCETHSAELRIVPSKALLCSVTGSPVDTESLVHTKALSELQKKTRVDSMNIITRQCVLICTLHVPFSLLSLSCYRSFHNCSRRRYQPGNWDVMCSRANKTNCNIPDHRGTLGWKFPLLSLWLFIFSPCLKKGSSSSISAGNVTGCQSHPQKGKGSNSTIKPPQIRFR